MYHQNKYENFINKRNKNEKEDFSIIIKKEKNEENKEHKKNQSSKNNFKKIEDLSMYKNNEFFERKNINKFNFSKKIREFSFSKSFNKSVYENKSDICEINKKILNQTNSNNFKSHKNHNENFNHFSLSSKIYHYKNKGEKFESKSIRDYSNISTNKPDFNLISNKITSINNCLPEKYNINFNTTLIINNKTTNDFLNKCNIDNEDVTNNILNEKTSSIIVLREDKEYSEKIFDKKISNSSEGNISISDISNKNYYFLDKGFEKKKNILDKKSTQYTSNRLRKSSSFEKKVISANEKSKTNITNDLGIFTNNCDKSIFYFPKENFENKLDKMKGEKSLDIKRIILDREKILMRNSKNEFFHKDAKKEGELLINRLEKKFEKNTDLKSNNKKRVFDNIYQNCEKNLKLSSKLDKIILNNNKKFNHNFEISYPLKKNDEYKEIKKMLKYDDSLTNIKNSEKRILKKSKKEILQEKYSKLIEKEQGIKNNEFISKISDTMAVNYRKELIKIFKLTFKNDKDNIFDDKCSKKDKNVNRNNIENNLFGIIRPTSVNKFHNKVENYLNNTMYSKEKLINHINQSLNNDVDEYERSRKFENNSEKKRNMNECCLSSRKISNIRNKLINGNYHETSKDKYKISESRNKLKNFNITFTKINNCRSILKNETDI